MITFEKQENGVLFTFENSDKYLYGSGTIEVPFNSLSIIQDESDMITLRKSASWDIFLSGRYDTDFNYGSKEDAVDALKEALFDETGGGVTEEEVEQMIEEATSGIPSSQVIEQLRTDVNAVSGEVDTLQDDVASKADASALTAVNDALTAHTANTNIHVTSTDKSNWDAKQDALTAGENITISGNVISAEAGNNIIELTQEEYDALVDKDPDALYIITDAQEINMNDYATKTDLAAKADVSALTAVSDAVTGKADASALTAVANDVQTVSGQVATKVDTSDFNAYSAATDARIAEDEEVTAAALNDLAETVSGKQDTLISGENIKTINNISILGSGNITISGGSGGGDYQYYSEDTTNESATIEVGFNSLKVDDTGVYVNDDPVVTSGELREYVTSEDLEDNYYTQQTIDEKEEVIASALTELNLRVTEDEEVTAAALNDLNSKIGSGGGALFVDYQDLIDNMNDDKWDELVNALQNKKPIFYWYDYSEGDITDAGQSPVDGYVYINQTEGEETTEISLKQLNGGGYYAVTIIKNGSEDYEVIDEGFEYQPIGDYQPLLQAGSGISIDENNVISVTGDTGSSVTVDSALTSGSTNAVENRAIYDKVTMEIEGSGVTYSDTPVTATTSGSRYYKVEFNDPDQYVTFTVAGLPDTIKLDGNTGQLTYTNGGAIPSGVIASFTNPAPATYEVAFGSQYIVTNAVANNSDIIYVGEPNFTTEWVKDVVGDLLETVSDKADTSAVTAAIDDAKAYYISFTTLATVGIHDEDWNGIVAAIDDHRPIYAGYPRTDGGIIYYGVECMNKNSGNTQIVMTASDDNQHYFYTFVKNGSNDYSYTVDTRPYTTNQEKTEWSAKQDALSAGTGISISNNVISTSGVVFSQTVTQLVKLTQAAYDALVTKDANTLYIISD